jgi:myosin heavy subunit
VRATTRTLQEQDKTVSGLRRRCVELEAEAARLRQETRTMEELRSRVRASDADRDRYVQETREIPLLKAQLKKHQEDLKSLDASHRRVKKMIRQTAIVSGAAVGQQQQQQQVQMPSSSSSIGPNLGNYSLTGSNNSTAFDTAASLGQGTNSISSPSPPPASSSSPLYASSGSPPLVGPSAGMSNSVLLSSSLGPGPSVAGNPYFNLFGSP